MDRETGRGDFPELWSPRLRMFLPSVGTPLNHSVALDEQHGKSQMDIELGSAGSSTAAAGESLFSRNGLRNGTRAKSWSEDTPSGSVDAGPVVCWRQIDRSARILISDSDPLEAEFLRRQLLSAGYRFFSITADSRGTLLRMREEQPDVVLLDAGLPGYGSLDMLRVAGLDPVLQHIPILLISRDLDGHLRRQALELGASDFLRRPLDEDELFPRVRNAIVVRRHYQREMAEVLRMEQQNEQLEITRRQLILCLARAAEHRDQHTGNHVVRVGKYAVMIARQMRYPEDRLNLLEQAAQLHDVGKIGIPDAILFKPGRLAEDEYELMKKHCTLGRQIIDPAGNRKTPYESGPNSSPLLFLAATIAHSHHERWDGTGYPLGLSRTDIPLEGRIVAVADVFDALASRRPYKEPFSREACLEIIRQGRGTQFDPEVVDAFMSCLSEIDEVQRRLMDQDEHCC
ncbi:MAG: Cyclic di-GMP phosphodiesterase response regulator RpfG [Planctomycetota bacterium]